MRIEVKIEMADRRISRGALNTVEDCPEEVEKDLVEHEDPHPAVHEDGQSGNLFTAILNRWLMSNTFYSSSVNSLRFK